MCLLALTLCQQQVSRTLGREGQTDELQQGPGQRQAEQEGPAVSRAQQLAQPEHLRHQYGDGDR